MVYCTLKNQVFGLSIVQCFLKKKNTFRKLDLFPSSGKTSVQ
jgi:hypothetical protein